MITKLLTKRNRISFENNPKDLETAILAEAGMCGNYIASQTGYSRGQVYTRTKKAGVKISDYRNGKGWVADVVRQVLRKKTSTSIELEKIIQHLAEEN